VQRSVLARDCQSEPGAAGGARPGRIGTPETVEDQGSLAGAQAHIVIDEAQDLVGDELTAVISHTVDRWDGREASRRIELFVGRDLQFVRINGTVVGGLVGLVIHAATILLP